MDVEVIFRDFFSIKESVEILPLMEAVITVAAFKHPEELAKRKSRIIKTLLNVTTKEVQLPKIEKCKTHICMPSKNIDDDQDRKHQRRVIKSPARSHGYKLVEEKTRVECKKIEEDHRALELKLASSKRKLQERYDEVKRGRKNIQVLELKDLPKAPMPSSSKITSQGNRIKRRCVVTS